MRKVTLSVLGCAALSCTTIAPASPRPCVGRDGKVIPCAKPTPKPAANHCKDAKGRFACKPEHSAPHSG